MTLSQGEYQAIIDDQSKVITADIVWRRSRQILSAMEFRVNINNEEGYPIFLRGWYNPDSGKLSYSIIHRNVGRIYGLDLGAEHRNPDGRLIGETHKNYWWEGDHDKWAYSPEDITETWNNPIGVWEQFCDEVNLNHSGRMRPPIHPGRQLV